MVTNNEDGIFKINTPISLKTYLDNNIKLGKLDDCIKYSIIMDKSSNNIRQANINNLCSGVSRLIGISNPNLPIIFDTLLDTWNLNKGDISEKRALISMLDLMSKSTKSDRNTHLKYVYFTCMKDNVIIENTTWDSIYNDTDLLQYTTTDIWTDCSERDDDSLKPLMNTFIHLLTNKDIRTYLYLYKISQLGKERLRFGQRFKGWSHKTEKPMTGRFKAEYAIWEYLFKLTEHIPNGKNILNNLEVLFKWYNTKNDVLIYLIHAISYFMVEHDWSNDNPPCEISDSEVDAHYNNKDLGELKLSGNLIKKDYLSFIYDIKDDLIYNIYKETKSGKVRKSLSCKSSMLCNSEECEELEEDPLHE